ncbi:MAG: selenocysteine-specific translation elongation factor [Deltaproteobacteria bacterium]|nr:selenocysteine-specific translation elongation factor [Deltaproteobacteria bacterium]
MILGTAGHIDHGKTALVRALTGCDTDRLPEEKARGITIELGFAPLNLPSGRRLGVVDVPGHEALVRTMVAGAGGFDLLLLAVAADEGVMPQTREHLDICTLLGLRDAVVALTKMDAADPGVAELALAETRAQLAESALADAEIVCVSAQSGAGLPALRRALDKTARRAEARAQRSGPARLWIDRVFERRGFGAVVTGTLRGGALACGDSVEIHPGSASARLRGLQCFGEAVQRIAPGNRCAANLQGVASADLRRGMLLAAPGALTPTQCFDAEIAWLPGAAPRGRSARAVELLAGSARRRARVAPIGPPPAADAGGGTRGAAGSALAVGGTNGAIGGGAGGANSGGALLARIHLDDGAAPLLPGDGFVLRGFARLAGSATLGGGRVLDAAPPRRRRSDPALVRELRALAAGDLREGLRLRIARRGFAGAALAALRHETGAEPAALESALGDLEARGQIARAAARPRGEARVFCAEAIAAVSARLLAALRDFHAREPMRPGMSRSALRGSLPESAQRGAAELALAQLEARGEIHSQSKSRGLVRAGNFAPHMDARQAALVRKVRDSAAASGLTPPSPRAWAQQFGADDAELRDAIAHLERAGLLLRAGALWFHRDAVAQLRERVRAHLEAHGRLDTPRYKELIATSRKYAVPLMELFDAEGLTTRRGDTRTLRRRR